MKKFLILTMAGAMLNMTYASSFPSRDSDSESEPSISREGLSDISSPGRSAESLSSLPLPPIQNESRRDFETSRGDKSATLPRLGVDDRVIPSSASNTSTSSSLGAERPRGKPKPKAKAATRSPMESECGFNCSAFAKYDPFTYETTPPPLSRSPSLPHRSQEPLAYPPYPVQNSVHPTPMYPRTDLSQQGQMTLFQKQVLNHLRQIKDELYEVKDRQHRYFRVFFAGLSFISRITQRNSAILSQIAGIGEAHTDLLDTIANAVTQSGTNTSEDYLRSETFVPSDNQLPPDLLDHLRRIPQDPGTTRVVIGIPLDSRPERQAEFGRLTPEEISRILARGTSVSHCASEDLSGAGSASSPSTSEERRDLSSPSMPFHHIPNSNTTGSSLKSSKIDKFPTSHRFINTTSRHPAQSAEALTEGRLLTPDELFNLISLIEYLNQFAPENQADFPVTGAHPGTAEPINFPNTSGAMSSVRDALRISSSASPGSFPSSPAPEIHADSDVDSDASDMDKKKDTPIKKESSKDE